MKFVTSNANVKMPSLIYGTAWKKERTKDLVYTALSQGFMGVDTACQPKHYFEPGVGEGLKKFFDLGNDRKEYFIQTKFTPLRGQDPNNIPYDKNETLTNQVNQSVEVSLKNLQVDYIDSLVLHSPLESWESLFEVWQAFESFVKSGVIKQIGISNCYHQHVLEGLYDQMNIKPSVLQNRFYEQTQYDREIRSYCRDKNIYYQSFWTLSANPHLLGSSTFQNLSLDKKKTPAQILFRYLIQNHCTPLTGTTSVSHMKEDLDIFDFELSESDLIEIQTLGNF